MTYATTVYTPVEDGHRYVTPGEVNGDCASCGAHPWADQHQLTESHRDLTDAELPSAVFAVEASDNGGRSYAANGLRWVDPEDAKRWAGGLALRWFGCTHIRVVRVAPPDLCEAHAHAYTVVEVVHQTL